MLGNIGEPENRRYLPPVPREDMGLAERYVMHELHNLEQTALEGYSSYNFPKVITSLTNFTNITLSSLYFDITKDCLYANKVTSRERIAVVTVLEQVLRSMTTVLAPVLPHLAEEIHSSWTSDGSSVFMTKWKPLSSQWKDTNAAEDMTELLRVRGVVLSLLEQARGNKVLKSSLEAEVYIVLPNDTAGTRLGELLRREERLLKTLFIVSDAVVTEEGSLKTSSPEWIYTDMLPISGCDEEVGIRVQPTTLHKCPRCWTYTRPAEETLCCRCSEVVEDQFLALV